MALDALHVDGLDGVAAALAQAHHVLAHPAGGAREGRGPQVERRLRLRLGVLGERQFNRLGKLVKNCQRSILRNASLSLDLPKLTHQVGEEIS